VEFLFIACFADRKIQQNVFRTSDRSGKFNLQDGTLCKAMEQISKCCNSVRKNVLHLSVTTANKKYAIYNKFYRKKHVGIGRFARIRQESIISSLKSSKRYTAFIVDYALVFFLI